MRAVNEKTKEDSIIKMTNSRFILLVGHIAEGFEAFGPFNTREDAGYCAISRFPNETYFILSISQVDGCEPWEDK